MGTESAPGCRAGSNRAVETEPKLLCGVGVGRSLFFSLKVACWEKGFEESWVITNLGTALSSNKVMKS